MGFVWFVVRERFFGNRLMADQLPRSENKAVPLDIEGKLGESAGGEILAVTISDVPPGAVLSAGTDNGDGTWSLAPPDLDGLVLTPPAGWSGEINMSVSASILEPGEDGGTQATTAFGYSVLVISDDVPQSLPEPAPAPEPKPAEPPFAGEEHKAPGFEGGAIALDIDTGLQDRENMEDLGVTISGVPPGAVLSAGADNGGGNWFLSAADLDGLTLQPPGGIETDFILGIAVTEGGEVVASGSLPVTVGAPPGAVALPEGPRESLAVEPIAGGDEAPGDRPSEYLPTAYWKLDERTPGAAVDEMGGHDGQTFGDQGAAGGAFDAVAVFDGIDDYIEVPHTDDMSLISGSFTAWFNAFAAGHGTLAAKGGGGGGPGSLFSLLVRDGKLEFRMQSGETSIKIDGGAFGANEWNQSTVTWGPAGMRAYLNGQLTGSHDHTGTLVGNPSPWLFGAAEAEGGEEDSTAIGGFFHGELDDIAIYPLQLTDAEVRELCQKGVEGMKTGKAPDGVDSALDFDAIPSEAEGPESLATVDSPRGPVDDGPEDAPKDTGEDLAASAPAALPEEPPLPVFPAPASLTVPEEPPPVPSEPPSGEDEGAPAFEPALESPGEPPVGPLGETEEPSVAPPPIHEPPTEEPAADAPAMEEGENVFVFGAGAGGDSYPGGDGWSESADLEAGGDAGEEGGGESGKRSRALKVAEGNELSFEDEDKLEW